MTTSATETVYCAYLDWAPHRHWFASLDGYQWLEVSRQVDADDLADVRELFTPVTKGDRMMCRITMTRGFLQGRGAVFV